MSMGMADLFDQPRNGAAPCFQPQLPATAENYARYLKLPLDFLRSQFDLRDGEWRGKPAVEIPYLDPAGQVVRIRVRTALAKGVGAEDRFKWGSGKKTVCMYGLEHLSEAIKQRNVVLVEGESDVQVAGYYKIPALGIPGASNWNDQRDAPHFEVIDEIFFVKEPDQGGDKLFESLRASSIADRVLVVDPSPHKDLAEAHKANPEEFKTWWRDRASQAVPISQVTGPSTDSEYKVAMWLTAEQIAAHTPDEPAWIVRPFLVEGAITEIDAAIKAGKSHFAIDLVRAICEGSEFLGQTAKPSPVVYLTEEGLATFGDLVCRLGARSPYLDVLVRERAFKLDWSAVIDETLAKAQQVGAKVVVVDTLSDWADIRGDAENSSGAALETMRPLRRLAATGLAVLVNRHNRKRGGAVGESARGSSAFGGSADIIFQLKRADVPGNSARRIPRAELERFITEATAASTQANAE